MHNILYIEDDENLARLLGRRMTRHGFSVTSAATGEEGVAILQVHKFDIILLDYHLPGISGLDVLDQIRDTNTAPVIILTAGGDERLAISALEKGAADYAIKDVNLSYIDLLPAIMQAAFTKTRLQRENELHQKELVVARDRAETASQAKTDFLAMMSHEIRTPMNVVVGLANLLTKTQLDTQQEEMVKTLKASADLLLTLINDLLDLNRIESGRVELEERAFSFDEIIAELGAMFASNFKEKNLDFKIDNQIKGREFIGDRTRIQQVLMNLTGNAVKFTASGGITVRLEAKTQANGKALISIAVSDTGIGIETDKLPNIFDKFVQADQTITRRFGGSGLGLAICNAIVGAMGGKLVVTSTYGQGSTFTIQVTLQESHSIAMHSLPAVEPIPQRAAGGTILLVEDYPANIMVATMMLEGLGYEVDSAPSGEEAMAKLELATVPYEAILMDVQMYGMDGYETTRKVRALEAQKGFNHYIIGVTAHALAGDREKCIECGMNDYMSKPINPDLLSKKLAARPVT